MRQLDIKVEETPGTSLVILDGSVDQATVDHFRRVLDGVCGRDGIKVLLDCRGLSYASSNCFGLLAKYTEACKKNGGRFAVCSCQNKLRMIIETLGLDNVLKLYDTREEALRSF